MKFRYPNLSRRFFQEERAGFIVVFKNVSDPEKYVGDTFYSEGMRDLGFRWSLKEMNYGFKEINYSEAKRFCPKL